MRKTMSKIISIINQKGGVAKTTTTFNLGYELASRGKKVLMIDLDSQGSLTVASKISNAEYLETIADYYLAEIKEEYYNAIDGIVNIADNLDLLPSCIKLAGIESQAMNVLMKREYILGRILENIQTAMRLKKNESYDYILIDCLPSLGIYCVNALTISDYVIIPTNPSHLSIYGESQLIKTIEQVKRYLNPKLQVLGLLWTLVDRRSNSVKETLQKENRGLHFKTEIPLSVRAVESSTQGKPVYEIDKNCKVAQAYSNLTDEILDTIE